MPQSSAKTIAQYALFIAVIMLLGLTPLGYITFPFAAITIVHVPVILGAFVFGVKGGALLGFFFGLTSLITCFMRPDAIAMIVLGTGTGFSFYNVFLLLMVLFVPRLCVGIFSALAYRALTKFGDTIAMIVSAIIGTLTNTVLLLGALAVFAFQDAGLAFGLEAGFSVGDLLKVYLGILSVNGVVETGVAVVICTAVGKAVNHYLRRTKKVA